MNSVAIFLSLLFLTPTLVAQTSKGGGICSEKATSAYLNSPIPKAENCLFYRQYSQLLADLPKNEDNEILLSTIKADILSHGDAPELAPGSPLYLRLQKLQAFYQSSLDKLISLNDLSGCSGMTDLSLRSTKGLFLNDLAIVVALKLQAENEMTAARKLILAALHANYLQLNCDLPLLYKIIATRNINSVFQILGKTKIFKNMKPAQKKSIRDWAQPIEKLNKTQGLRQAAQLEGKLLLMLNWGEQILDPNSKTIYKEDIPLSPSSPFSFLLKSCSQQALAMNWTTTLKEVDELYTSIAEAAQPRDQDRLWTQNKFKFAQQLIQVLNLKNFGISQPTDFYDPTPVTKFYDKFKSSKDLAAQFCQSLGKTENPGGLLHQALLFSSMENNPAARLQKLSAAWDQMVLLRP